MFRVIKRNFILFLTLSLLSFGCREKKADTLFSFLSSDQTGLDFNNEITENDSINIITLEYVYNGGGVAAADFNNDGLCDIFFGGNIVADRLYLNRGNLKFEDVSDQAGIIEVKKWRSGVAVVDINNDGLLDIYVCATIKKDSVSRANILYVNQGLSEDGVPSFVDQASQYGIADTGHSSNAAFFDYDNDGDLDLYVLTNTIESGVPTTYRPKINDGSALNTDRLYRNNGQGFFDDVSDEAGILLEGYGLGLAIADINQDGWQDIYVSNDYIANDILYINNGNGTFTNQIDKYIRHQSQFSMGNDVADINNDGLPDIITLDMLPEGNLRRKTVINGASYISYQNNKQYRYAHQYIRNMLQLNNGNGTFSEIGQMAGVYQTEWSWSPLFADFDNDGLKDLIITNGFPKDVTDKDFSNFRNGAAGAVAPPKFLSDSIPIVKVPNHAYKNVDGLSFQSVIEQWGMNYPSFSNGAAFADFDNDGDLDYVVNNINDQAFFFQNNLYSSTDSTGEKPHYLRMKLVGDLANKSGLGAKIRLKFNDGKIQYYEHSIYRGYISCVEDVVHFGLGKNTVVDSVLVVWPDQCWQLLSNVKSDQLIKISYSESKEKSSSKNSMFQETSSDPTYFRDISSTVNFIHTEQDRIDFNLQRTIPHKFSQSGPGISVGDTNGDGLEDFFIGGSVGYPGNLFIQDATESFKIKTLPDENVKEKTQEDEGSLLFDADNDGDLDLYIVSGGFESEANHISYQDRLYRNDGHGNYKLDPLALPEMKSSKSCVRAADYDNDGDLDLFVGTRVIPGKYPFSSESYLLENRGGNFINVTRSIAPELIEAGMITDAIWTDINNDKKIDLVVVGEFMPIQFYLNNGNFAKVKDTGIDKFSGWWNSIVGGDFDRDGDTDYIAGNLGLNNYYHATETYPLTVYAKDIDENGTVDALLSCYFKSETGEMKEYPVNFWDELNSLSPKFRRKFANYHAYGKATINEVLTESEREGSLILKANYMSTSYIRNLGSGKFELVPLPKLSQVAPVNGLIAEDFNTDGFLDVLMVGNDYGNEVFSGRYDAFNGLLMLNDGKGNFSCTSPGKSGFFVSGDAKGLAKVTGRSRDFYVATQNQDSLKVFKGLTRKDTDVFTPKAKEWFLVFKFTDGTAQKVEFYYGSGYLSQSSRGIRVPPNVKEMIVYDYNNQSRTVHY